MGTLSCDKGAPFSSVIVLSRGSAGLLARLRYCRFVIVARVTTWSEAVDLAVSFTFAFSLSPQ